MLDDEKQTRLEDIQMELTELRGDVLWLETLLENMDGEAGLHNLRRVRDYICGHANTLAISARKLVQEAECG